MAAYIVANYKVTNPEGYEKYVPAIMPSLAAHNVEILAADAESQVLEGEPGHMTVVLKFADKAAAKAWYDSPEYQSGVHHRQDNTEGVMVIADEFQMPD